MIRFARNLLILLVASCSAVTAQAEIVIDFGNTNAPGANVNVISATQQNLANAVDTSGSATGISFTIQNGNGFHPLFTNSNGDTSPANPAGAVFDSGTTSDSLFGHNTTFDDGVLRDMVEYSISGLDVNRIYSFNIYASRQDGSGDRTSVYSMAGANSASASLDAAFTNTGDTGALAVITGITPAAGGTINFSIEAGPTNSTSAQFFYVGGLQMTSVQAIPEPGSLVLALSVSVVFMRRRR
ncbi:MAG: hypothetical protein AAF456_17475 [Planctomycetota bacterium]